MGDWQNGPSVTGVVYTSPSGVVYTSPSSVDDGCRSYALARMLTLAYEREGQASNPHSPPNQSSIIGGGHSHAGGSDEESSGNEALAGSLGEADGGRDRHSDSASVDSSAILVEGSEGGFSFLDGNSDLDE